jgi:hypothetical protein
MLDVMLEFLNIFMIKGIRIRCMPLVNNWL